MSRQWQPFGKNSVIDVERGVAMRLDGSEPVSISSFREWGRRRVLEESEEGRNGDPQPSSEVEDGDLTPGSSGVGRVSTEPEEFAGLGDGDGRLAADVIEVLAPYLVELHQLSIARARVLDLCAEWDRLSKGETPTTARIRAAINGRQQ